MALDDKRTDYDMSSVENPFSVEPTSLSPGQRGEYESVQRSVKVILDAGSGDRLMYLLNAIALSSPKALETMNVWSELALSGRMDARDITGLTHDRPLSLPAMPED